MKYIDADAVTEEMISAGAAMLGRLLFSYDVQGSWDSDEVLPDVFRAMAAVAPPAQHGGAQADREAVPR